MSQHKTYCYYNQLTSLDLFDILNDGGIIIYPTDTMYAIGCHGLKERAI